MPFEKLLVANRGEIAVRIFRTCRRLGIATVAVAAPDDARALHTRVADEVRAIDSYLSSQDVIRAACDAGAKAVHPGYGFLAEQADFAEAVEAAGLVWIGPPPDALRASGDKVEAKRIAAAAGVPLLPSGTADDLGFPLLVKAAAGGGGRGMRLVRTATELPTAIEAAEREARAAFGDGTLFLERYLERPRHVEIQLLADRHTTVVALGERECSIQRRHQKILEESPSPAVGGETRERMAAAAIAFARAVGYTSAGTAEFLLEGDEFFFLELNARIQVEHPVTELVTGLDLVEQQLGVAAGERLELGSVDPEGHAVEARLYAEHPLSFLPQAGRIERLELPDGIRVDAGVEAGDDVPVAYDPLLAKLIAHGESRAQALDRLAAALRSTSVGGVTTNLPFLRWLVGHPDFRAGSATVAFLEDNPPLSRYPRYPRPWRAAWRLAAEPPARRPPPTVEAAAHRIDTGGIETSTLRAPMPGTVLRVLAAAGDRVEPRQPLVVLEAMKMETPLVSPYEAVVRHVHVAEGDRVTGGALLVELEE